MVQQQSTDTGPDLVKITILNRIDNLKKVVTSIYNASTDEYRDTLFSHQNDGLIYVEVMTELEKYEECLKKPSASVIMHNNENVESLKSNIQTSLDEIQKNDDIYKDKISSIKANSRKNLDYDTLSQIGELLDQLKELEKLDSINTNLLHTLLGELNKYSDNNINNLRIINNQLHISATVRKTLYKMLDQLESAVQKDAKLSERIQNFTDNYKDNIYHLISDEKMRRKYIEDLIKVVQSRSSNTDDKHVKDLLSKIKAQDISTSDHIGVERNDASRFMKEALQGNISTYKSNNDTTMQDIHAAEQGLEIDINNLQKSHEKLQQDNLAAHEVSEKIKNTQKILSEVQSLQEKQDSDVVDLERQKKKIQTDLWDLQDRYKKQREANQNVVEYKPKSGNEIEAENIVQEVQKIQYVDKGKMTIDTRVAEALKLYKEEESRLFDAKSDKDNTKLKLETSQNLNNHFDEILKNIKEPIIIGGRPITGVGAPADEEAQWNVIANYRMLLSIMQKSANVMRLSALSTTEFSEILTEPTNPRGLVQVTYKYESVYKTMDSIKLAEIMLRYFYIDITELVTRMYTSLEKKEINREEKLFPYFREKFFKGYEEAIVNDTKNYYAIVEHKNLKDGIKATTNRKYIYVKKFIEILEGILSPDADSSFKGNISNIFTRYVSKMRIIGIIDSFAEVLKAFEDPTNKTVRDKLEQVLKDKSNQTMLTYLRIRCDDYEDETKSYNKRFDIGISQDGTMMHVKYNDHDFPYYSMEKQKGKWVLSISPEVQKLKDGVIPEMGEGTKEWITKYSEYFKNTNNKPINFSPNSYDYEYIFGPFTRIFPPLMDPNNKLKNDVVGDNLKEIVEQLENKNHVFIIGYGASGAGKTSSLIYFNQEKENGILMYLCNQLAKTYPFLNLKSYEFFVDPTGDHKTDEDPKVVPCDESSILFMNNGSDGFVLAKEYNHTNYFTDRIDIMQNKNGNPRKTNFPAKTPMGEVMIHLIDNDRYVKATTNNPNSSRSHAMIVVKFMTKENDTSTDNPILIIGDFAGVENAFKCESFDVLAQFSDIRIDNDAKKPPFYSVYASGVPEDSKRKCIKGGSNPGQEALCMKYSTTTDSIYIPQRSDRRKATPESMEDNLASFFPYLSDYQLVERVILELVQIRKLQEARSAQEIRTLFDSNRWKYDKAIRSLDLFYEFDTLVKQEKDPKKVHQQQLLFVKKVIAAALGSQKVTLFDHLDEFSKQAELVNNLRETGARWGNWYHGKFGYRVTISSADRAGLTWGNVAKQARNSLEEYKNTLNNTLNAMLTTKPPSKGMDAKQNQQYEKQKKFQFFEFDLIDPTKKQNIDGQDVNPAEYTDRIRRYRPLQPNEKPDQMMYVVDKVRDYFQSNFVLTDILGFQLEGVSDDSMNVFDAVIKAFKSFQDNRGIMSRVDNFKTILNYIYSQTTDLYIEMFCRGKASKKICEIRRNEGFMINRTLAEIRGAIRKVITEKNKNSISIVPPFVDQCLPYYCVSGSCFPSSGNTSDKSIIFKILQKELGNSISKLVMSVFCVYNISYRANNPPPVPYIDINMLKTKHLQYKNNGTVNHRNTLVREARRVIHKIETDLKNKTSDIQNLVRYDEFKESVKWKNEMLQDNILRDDININDVFINLDQNIAAIKQSIDASNASTALGTLEFVDSLAKYYSTEIVCQPNKLSYNDKQGIAAYDFKDVLQVKPPVTFKGGSKMNHKHVWTRAEIEAFLKQRRKSNK